MTKIRKNHSCKPYTIYKAAGFFICELCEKEFHYTDLGLKLDYLVQFYDSVDDMMQYVILKT